MFRLALTGAVAGIVCACAASDLPPRAANARLHTARPSAGPNFVWYAGRAGDRLLAVKLTSLDGGRTRMEATVQNEPASCDADYAGTGVFRRGILAIQDESLPACRLSLTRAGHGLVINPGPGCASAETQSCSIAGRLLQR